MFVRCRSEIERRHFDGCGARARYMCVLVSGVMLRLSLCDRFFGRRIDHFIRLRVGRTSRSFPVMFRRFGVVCAVFFDAASDWIMGEKSECVRAAWGESASCLEQERLVG